MVWRVVEGRTAGAELEIEGSPPALGISATGQRNSGAVNKLERD
jgi:hypothetical protein